MGGSSSKSESSNSSGSAGFNQSYIDKQQKGYLNDLWGNASNSILNNGMGQANQGAQSGFLDTLQNNPMMGNVMSFADPNNAIVSGQLKQLNAGLNDQFQNQLMPQIADQAVQGGALGGGRQGVAQGLGVQGMQQAYSQGAQGILSNAYNQAQQASQFGAGLLQQGASAGLQGLGQIQQQQFAPLMALAQILGNPTVLQRGQNLSTSSGSSNSQSQEAHIW